jgi:hypothetical protein
LRRAQELAPGFIREAREHGDPYWEHSVRVLSAFRLLCDDRVDEALEEWRHAVTAYPENDVYRDAIWGVAVGLYAGRIDIAQQAAAISKALFWRSTILFAFSRAVHLWSRGSVAAAELARGAGFRARAQIRLTCCLLRLENAPIAAAFREHLSAVLAYRANHTARAVRHLERCCRIFSEHQLEIFAACADALLARLHPAPAARLAHRERADAVFAREGLKRPELWVRALLPGFEHGGAASDARAEQDELVGLPGQPGSRDSRSGRRHP